MSTSDDLTFDDRIVYVKEKIDFFIRPLIYLFPIYPEEDEDEYSIPSNFNIDIIDIEVEFGKFQNKFNSVFITEKGKINALKYFDQFFNHQLGYVTVPDESVPGGERYQFDWAKLVFYLIKEYEGSSNYWEYFRNWLDDGNNHIFKGYDEKIEQMAMEAHEKLINKFNSFKEETEIKIFEGKRQNDEKSNAIILPQKSPNKIQIHDLKVYELIFNSPENKNKLFDLIKDLFPGREVDLMSAFEGKEIDQKLLFKGQQNIIGELFRRIKLNGFITSNDTQITNWLIEYFEYVNSQGETPVNRILNQSTIYDLINKGKGIPPKNKRICQVEWLPFKIV